MTEHEGSQENYHGQLRLVLDNDSQVYFHTDDILPDTRTILQEACAISGRGIVVVPEPGLDAYARVWLARGDQPLHLIYYDPTCSVHPEYLVAHECGHIIRCFTVPPEDRILPAVGLSEYEAALNANKDEIVRLRYDGVPARQLDYVVQNLYLSVISGLLNGPPDIHIEKWIYENYPAFREMQYQAWLDGIKAGVGLLQRKEPYVPSGMWRTYATLAHAIDQESSYVIGCSQSESPFASDADHEKASELRYMLREIGDQGHLGDVQTANQWAEYLGVRDWFDWANYYEEDATHHL